MSERGDPIRILMVEDLEYEADLVLLQLRKAGLHCVGKRVETEQALRHAISEFDPTVILSDFSLPQFDGLSALNVAQELVPDVPFIFLSGTIGEERAIDALHRGAADYVLKGNSARLVPAVKRALEDKAVRQARREQEAQIARLNRVLRMLSGINGLVLRIRDQVELLRESCRLAVSAGGYAAAAASLKISGTSNIQPVAWFGIDEGTAQSFLQVVEAMGTELSSPVNRALRDSAAQICNDTADVDKTGIFNRTILKAGLRSTVVLPLAVDGTAIGVLALAAPDAGIASDEELQMLQEVAGSLSFGLQYVQKDTAVRFLSHFDPQSGLAKRPLFCERLGRILETDAPQAAHLAIAVIDIERLSVINDYFGRRIGDMVLQHVAERLRNQVTHTDRIAHFGGGTFAIVRDIEHQTSADLQTVVRDNADRLVKEPFVIEGRQITVSLRTGFALYPRDGEDANGLVQNAEAALHSARAEGERQSAYDAARHSRVVDRLSLEFKLRAALERDEFELFYQPKIGLISRAMEGAEALIRWRDPERGVVPPASFLPVLESSGLIADVGLWVVRRAARDCEQWMRAGLPKFRVAVNVAPLQLRCLEFDRLFLDALGGWATRDCGLDIEITESALHDEFAVELTKLNTLREAGVRIAIDDFGTGYSSLSRLSTLPIDTLKIDRSFISRSSEGRTGAVIRSIISLAKAFDMTTVAEGVETQEQFDYLAQIDCDQSQGYLHSKPVPANEFVRLFCPPADAAALDTPLSASRRS